MPKVEVVEYTDAVCSTAWGAEPLLRRLDWRHGHHLTWRKVMGGLVGNAATGKDGWDRVSAAEPMSAYWKRVWKLTGMPYPHPMRLMLQSTDPLGAAVKAAELQGQDVAHRVLRRFREQIFLFGIGPQTPDEFEAATQGVPGLDQARWRTDQQRPDVAAAYQADWRETREPNDYVRHLKHDSPMNGELKHSEGHDRYALPTLIFKGPGGEHTVAGWVPYEEYEAGLEAAMPGATADPRPDPTPQEAFARWGVLTEQELAFLCGQGAEAPAGAATYDWGDGLAYFNGAEAQGRL
ncbi:protein-disulfide isomerase-like protein with CxxC motif [Caulobacter ginsengisoli]|uniref:Protein-disulfide isomerase-like protein with CxxC motif n=1 Tax=Caulobacter ginsengisoli TaxID=400775 RepID=A0ABU0IUV5_9CAUL|nr:DsbA family protein [Caulobacter ginsengisoli]MDQ0465803.1 protein-disulfide isomerase-like protein with CxxC motif [Caulobacter ginsengisoli]